MKQVYKEFIYLLVSICFLISCPVMMMVSSGKYEIIYWVLVMCVSTWLVAACHKDFIKAIYNMNELRQKQINQEVDLLHYGKNFKKDQP